MENPGIIARAQNEQGGEKNVDYDQMIADMDTRVPDKLKEAWNRVMAAGMKFLFDKQTNPMVNEYLDGEGDIATKLGEGAAGLIAFLDKQSNGAMPKELVIPAGIALLVEVVKYVQKAGMADVTAADFGNAVNVYLEKVLGVYGGNMDQMGQTLEVATKDMQPGGETAGMEGGA